MSHFAFVLGECPECNAELAGLVRGCPECGWMPDDEGETA